MKEQKIIVGTKDEIVDYCYKLSESYRPHKPQTGDYNHVLCEKQGFIEQIDEYRKKCNGDMGVLFYLKRNEDESKNEINLELCSVYYKIQNESK